MEGIVIQTKGKPRKKPSIKTAINQQFNSESFAIKYY